MRLATQDTESINIGDQFTGIALGYDRCAEHECGAKDLFARLGVEGTFGEGTGLARHRITKPENIILVSAGDGVGIAALWGSEEVSDYVTRDLNSWRKDGKEYSASWGDREFVVVGWTPEAKENLKALYEAIQAGHGTISFGGKSTNNPFGGSGPCICRTDLFPEEWTRIDEEQKAAQLHREKWEAEWREETKGLFAALCEMGDAVHTLCGGYQQGYPAMFLPLHCEGYKHYGDRWYQHPDVRGEGKKGVWLNPERQDLWNAGWYSSEDLWAWSKGEGRIWNLCAAVPSESHPFWGMLRNSIPSPDSGRKKEWHVEWPWTGPTDNHGDTYDHRYLNGNGIWDHISKKFGCSFESGNYHNPTRHSLFREDRERAAAAGLPLSVIVRDEALFKKTVAEWNANNPDNKFNPMMYGRGEDLAKRLKEAK